MKVHVLERKSIKSAKAENVIIVKDKYEMFEKCDVVICSLPITKQTIKYIDENCFKKIKE
eukprot:Pgem_evm1s11425